MPSRHLKYFTTLSIGKPFNSINMANKLFLLEHRSCDNIPAGFVPANPKEEKLS